MQKIMCGRMVGRSRQRLISTFLKFFSADPKNSARFQKMLIIVAIDVIFFVKFQGIDVAHDFSECIKEFFFLLIFNFSIFFFSDLSLSFAKT